MSMFATPPESGKKLDANGGRKLAADLTPQERENRLALLQQFYCDPLNEGEESAFNENGLAITPPYEDCGPLWATAPEECPLDEGDEDSLFEVVEFDPQIGGEGLPTFEEYLNS